MSRLTEVNGLGDVSSIGNFIEFLVTPATMKDTENIDDEKQHVLNPFSIMMNA